MSVKVLIACAAALVVVLGLVLWQTAGTAASPVERGAAGLASGAASPAEPDAVPEPARREVESAPTRESRASAPAADLLEVRGSVVIVDPEGNEHRSESGQLVIAFGSGERDQVGRAIAFADGAWSARIPRGSRLAFRSLVAGGRDAVLDDAAPVAPGSEPIEVRGKWLATGRLRVVDALTQQDLRGIEVRSSNRGWRANPEWTHPGDHPAIATVLSDAVSPFDLPKGLVYATWWVHAPGYAWAKVDIDQRVGGQRVVELVQAASVEVSVAGKLPAGALVRLYEIGGPALAGGRVESWLARASVNASARGATRIDDFQPGRYLACVETGEYEDTRRFGEAEVELAAGTTGRVTIALDQQAAKAAHGHLFGTLLPPRGARVDDWHLTLTKLDGGAKPVDLRVRDMSTTSADSDTRRWDAGQVPAGDWLATVQPVQHRVLLNVVEGAERPVAIELPGLVEVEVEVVDAATGSTLTPTRLGWSDGALEGVAQNSISKASLDADSRTWRFTTVEGEIEVNCAADGYEPRSEKLAVRAPSASVRFEMKRACGVRLRAYDGDSLVPLGFQLLAGARAVPLDGQPPTGRSGGGSDSEFTIHIASPGRYRLQFPALDGYEPVEPIEVDIPADTLVDVRVPVRRSR